ncbi:hypothetical protein BDW22DRAFT_1344745 [Trametopsis cervina]|nr:hypothetical protein BDW22DRAFT_1344745 [Trametopsis cervina]
MQRKVRPRASATSLALHLLTFVLKYSFARGRGQGRQEVVRWREEDRLMKADEECDTDENDKGPTEDVRAFKDCLKYLKGLLTFLRQPGPHQRSRSSRLVRTQRTLDLNPPLERAPNIPYASKTQVCVWYCGYHADTESGNFGRCACPAPKTDASRERPPSSYRLPPSKFGKKVTSESVKMHCYFFDVT